MQHALNLSILDYIAQLYHVYYKRLSPLPPSQLVLDRIFRSNNTQNISYFSLAQLRKKNFYNTHTILEPNSFINNATSGHNL